MFAKSLLAVPAFAIAIGVSQPTIADDVVPPDLKRELAEAKQALIEATERLRRVEARITDLQLDNQPKEVDGIDFMWRVLGLRVDEVASHVIEDANKANRTKYKGAMTVAAVRPSSPADSQGIRTGDLLLGIDGMQTITNGDIRGLARKELELVAKAKVKFYILRNGQTLFGHFALHQR